MLQVQFAPKLTQGQAPASPYTDNRSIKSISMPLLIDRESIQLDQQLRRASQEIESLNKSLETGMIIPHSTKPSFNNGEIQ
jgi:hypothetical protein